VAFAIPITYTGSHVGALGVLPHLEVLGVFVDEVFQVIIEIFVLNREVIPFTRVKIIGFTGFGLFI
jgi:hypothetical protein